LNFRHTIITGGEPLSHPQAEGLLDMLAGLRTEIKPLLTVLRTNLSIPMDYGLLRKVACSTDQVVVSLDGDRGTHDQRRGKGSYDSTLDNLRALVELRTELGEDFTDLSLAAVLSVEQVNSAPGASVRAIADELDIRRSRFRPMLPLGRAIQSELEITPEALWSYLSGAEMLAYGFSPTTSCGIGQNLYIEPDGVAYPCYAWHGERWSLGSIFQEAGLPLVTESPRFRSLNAHTVDANQRCRACELRYLCGGACRAWNRYPEQLQHNLDAPPLDCSALHHRAQSILLSALQLLGIPASLWKENGLPLPESPPLISP
jgi:uncharacterized protein